MCSTTLGELLERHIEVHGAYGGSLYNIADDLLAGLDTTPQKASPADIACGTSTNNHVLEPPTEDTKDTSLAEEAPLAGATEAAPTPKDSVREEAEGGSPRKWRSRCIWREFCEKGLACTYLHSARERAYFAAHPTERLVALKTRPCTRGACRNADIDCPFGHEFLFCTLCGSGGTHNAPVCPHDAALERPLFTHKQARQHQWRPFMRLKYFMGGVK